MGLFLGLGIGFALLAIAICVGLKLNKKNLASGEIIERKPNFMNDGEEFTLNTVIDPIEMKKSLIEIHNKLGVSLQGNTEVGKIGMDYVTFKTQIKRMSQEEGKSVYRFEFIEWKTRRGMPENAIMMNKLATAVERMFSSFDPNVTVRTYERDISRHLTLF